VLCRLTLSPRGASRKIFVAPLAWSMIGRLSTRSTIAIARAASASFSPYRPASVRAMGAGAERVRLRCATVSARRVNPAQLLFAALHMRDLEPRLSEALPWIVYQYPDLNWPWLVQRARLHDLQKRLGFVVALARQVAERKEQAATAATLAAVEQQLEPSRLAREDTLCRESMTQAERRWLRKRRPALAQHWNLLTGLVPEHLSYVA
jgi:hypothetical protein